MCCLLFSWCSQFCAGAGCRVGTGCSEMYCAVVGSRWGEGSCDRRRDPRMQLVGASDCKLL